MTPTQNLDPDLARLAEAVDAAAEDRLYTRSPYTDHDAIADRLAARPGVWQLAAIYPKRTTEVLASKIRTGRYDTYRERGTFTAAALPVGMGTGLYIRCITPRSPH